MSSSDNTFASDHRVAPPIVLLEFQDFEFGRVITPFLPTGFSRVPARKTGKPGPSQHDPMKPHHVKYSHEEGPGHISQGLTKFD